MPHGCDAEWGLWGGELVPPHEALEGGAVNPKSFGSPGDVSVVLLEGRLEELFLQALEGFLLPLVEAGSRDRKSVV